MCLQIFTHFHLNVNNSKSNAYLFLFHLQFNIFMGLAHFLDLDEIVKTAHEQSSSSAWFGIAKSEPVKGNFFLFLSSSFVAFVIWLKYQLIIFIISQKNPTKEIYQILAKLTTGLSPMVQSSRPTICNITKMCKCIEDFYLF